MKRAIAAMLVLVLSLGVVAPTWAEETGEEDVVLQATGETYDAGEDTVAPMMMLAARGAAATAASTGLDCTKGVAAGKIEEKFADYVNHAMKYYVKKLEGEKQPILLFFEGVRKDASTNYKSTDYSKISATRNAAVCIVVKFAADGTPQIAYCLDECSTFPDRPLDFEVKKNGYSRNVIVDGAYKIKLDNHSNDGVEDYAAFTIDVSKNYLRTGDADKNAFYFLSNNMGGGYTHQNISSNNENFQIHGRSTAETPKNYYNSTGCILAGAGYSNFSDFLSAVTGIGEFKCSGKPPKVEDVASSANVTAMKKDLGYVVIDRAQYVAELTDLYTGSGSCTTDGEPDEYSIGKETARTTITNQLCATSMAVKEEFDKQSACPYAPHDPGVTLSDGTYQFRTAQKDGKWTALCKGCGVVYDYMASFNTGDAGVYKVVDATGDGLCSAPYRTRKPLFLP